MVLSLTAKNVSGLMNSKSWDSIITVDYFLIIINQTFYLPPSETKPLQIQDKFLLRAATTSKIIEKNLHKQLKSNNPLSTNVAADANSFVVCIIRVLYDSLDRVEIPRRLCCNRFPSASHGENTLFSIIVSVQVHLHAHAHPAIIVCLWIQFADDVDALDCE